MSGQIISLDFGKPHTAAAEALAWLICARKTSSERQRYAELLGGRALRLFFKAGASSIAGTPEEWAIATQAKVVSSKRIENLLRNVFLAADLATPAVFTSSDLDDLLQGSYISQAQRRESALTDSGLDIRNFEKRVWARTLPVMHLAIAYAFLAQNALRLGYRLSPDVLLTSPEITKMWLELAIALENPVLHTFPRGLKEETQVRLRLAS